MKSFLSNYEAWRMPCRAQWILTYLSIFFYGYDRCFYSVDILVILFVFLASFYKLSTIKSDLYLRYRIEDLITPHYRSCLVLIILTDQIMTFMRLYFGSFDQTSVRRDTESYQQNDSHHL